MKRLFSIFALAALMLLGMGGAANAKNITENVFEVGHTFSCKASKQDGGTEYGSLTFKVTQVGSTTTPGQVTLITFMSDWGDYSPSYWSGALWIPSYFTDPAGRKYVLTRIGDNVFQGGANISYIYFNYETDEMFDYVGNSVNFNIGNYSFAGCSKMTSVTKYSPTYRTGFTVANIGKYAFQNCSSLTMSMYSNIGGSIGEGAYENCSAMTTVNASGSISATAFKGCTAVKLINWHGGYSTKLTSGSESPMYPMRFSVTEIYITGAVPAYFFYNFTALTKVTSYTKFYDNLKNTNIYHMGVGEYGFGYCTSLQSIQVAGEINKYAFYGCNNLTSITYRGGYFAESQIPTSGSESFFNPVRSKITSFTFDETSTKTKPNTYIPAYICYGMTKLTKVTIPEYAKSIGKGAFQSCTSLETVTFSGTPTCSIIGEEAFDNCEKLSSITLPASVEYIYPEAFYYCRALTKCPISASNTNLKYIGTRAFYASKMTSFYVPESVKTLGQNLIDGSTGDTEITEITFMPKNLTRSNVGGSWANLFFDLGTVANRRKVTTFRVNSALTSIPDSLCYNFQGLEYVTDQNKSASLSSLVTIGKSSFQLCKALSGIIASNLTTIGDYAFAESAWGDDLGSNGWFNLKKIGQYAFSGSQITKIGTSVAYWPLPALTEIGAHAFDNCAKLHYINLPEKLTKIGEGAFDNCPELNNIDLNSVELKMDDPLGNAKENIAYFSIGEKVQVIPNAFLKGSAIKKLDIPSSVQSIGDEAFWRCESLDSVRVSSDMVKTSISAVNKAPFYECKNLKKVIFRDGVASIPDLLFAEANNIETLNLGTVSNIGARAFLDCSLLSELVFDNVKAIGEEAFRYNLALETIRINKTIPSVASNSFFGDEVKTIYASCSIIDDLKKDASWTAVCNNIQGSDSKFTEDYLWEKTGIESDHSWYSWNCTIEIEEALDCEGHVTLRAVPYDGYTFYYWRDNGSQENPRAFDLNDFSEWWQRISAFAASDDMLRQTNFSVSPEGAGVLKITNEFGHNRNNQKFVSGETAHLTPMETNGWYQFDKWEYTVDYEHGGMEPNPCDPEYDPTTMCVNINYMSEPGEEIIDPETGMPMPGEMVERAMFDENMKALFVIKDIDVTVESCSDANGEVELSKVNAKLGEEVTLTAKAKEGFLFEKWSDGSTDATRKLTLSPAMLIEHRVVGYDLESDMMLYEDYPVDMGGGSIEPYHSESTYFLRLCASFKIDPNYKKKYTITAESEDESKGTVTGGGVYEEGSTVTLTATAKSGFDFVQWNDGITDNPRTVTVAGDATYKAEFAIHINYFDIIVKADPEEGGIVTGGGNFAENQEIELEAIANSGYEFIEWSDGVKTEKRSVKVTKNETFTAKFKKLEVFFTISVAASPAEGGVITGGGNYKEGAVVTLTASANEGYEFVRWTDGVLQASREITVTADATYTAEFKVVEVKPIFTITVLSDNEDMGTVSGGGTYEQGSVISITALPKDGYNFLEWSDGNKSNPRQVAVVKDETFVAKFEKAQEEQKYFTITVISANPTMGSVIGGNTYLEGSVIQIAAIPNAGYQFSMWNDGNKDNPREIVVEKDEIFVASFEELSASSFTITVLSENEEMGTVFGGGTFNEGQVATIAAVANEGYEFVQWSDGNTDNPRQITVVKDETFTAQFKLKESAVENLEGGKDVARKVMIDGVIYIIKGDKLYNVLGAEVK